MTHLSPSIAAGLVLAVIPVLNDYNLPAPAASAVLEATGAKRTTAYKVRSAVEASLTELLRPPGRPAAPPPEPPPDTTALHRAIVTFLYDNPGAVGGSAERRRYSNSFHLFILDLCEARRELPLERIAEAAVIPLPTLRDWLRGERPQVSPPDNLATVPDPAPARIQAVLDAWERWADRDKGFVAFCDHVSFHVFEGKKKAGTLPEGVDGRYLRGIVKNLAEEAEGWHIAEALLRERLAARDLMLAHLGHQQDAIEEEGPEPADLVKAFVPHDQRLAATRFLFAKVVTIN